MATLPGITASQAAPSLNGQAMTQLYDEAYGPWFRSRGLLISHQAIVPQHRGRLLTSTTNEGATFTIELPRLQPKLDNIQGIPAEG